MDEAEFAAWLHGSPETEGLQSLIEVGGCEGPWSHSVEEEPQADASAVPCRAASSPEEAHTVEKGPEPSNQNPTVGGTYQEPEVLGMMTNAIMCQSCGRQYGVYQCLNCTRVNCVYCTTDDPERASCRLPCGTTELRPTKRMRNAMGLSSAFREAASGQLRTPGSEGSQAEGIGTTVLQSTETASGKNREPYEVATVARLQERVNRLDGKLPSEMVGTPEAPGAGWYELLVAVVLWIGMAFIDIGAWFWYGWDLARAVVGWLPPRCTVLCRCVVDKTVEPRVLCGKQCVLPADHGAEFVHCCGDHLRYGGRLTPGETPSWKAFSWGHRVCRKAQLLGAATYRLLFRWKIVQLAMLWVCVYTG